MVVNRKIETGIVSVIFLLLIGCLVFNIFGGVFDHRRTSSILSVAYLASIFCLCAVFFAKRRVVRIQWVDALLLGYFLYAACRNGTAFSISHLGSIALLLLYVGIRIRGRRLPYRMLYGGILVGSLSLSIYGYIQYAHYLSAIDGEYKILGPFYNPAPYAALLCFLLSVQVVVLATCRKKVYIYATLLSLLLSLPAFIIADSRAAFLALLAVAVFAYKKRICKLPVWSKGVAIAGLLVVIVVLCLFLYKMRPDSIKGRLLIWKISSEMIQDAPVAGLGYNGFEANYMNYQGRYFEQGKGSEIEKYVAGSVVSAYNEPVRITVEYGVTGLIIYLMLLYLLFFRTQGDAAISKAAKAVILASVIFGLFSYPNKICSLQVVVIMAIACLLNMQVATGYKVHFKVSWYLTVGKWLFLLCTVFFIFTTVRYHISYKQFRSLLHKPPTGLTTQIETLSPVMEGDYLFLLNSCVFEQKTISPDDKLNRLNKALLLSPSYTLNCMKGDCLLQLSQYKQAEEAYWAAHYMIPSRQQARANIAKLYLKMNKVKEAKELARSIVSEKVKVYGFQTYEIHQEMKKIISAEKQ